MWMRGLTFPLLPDSFPDDILFRKWYDLTGLWQGHCPESPIFNCRKCFAAEWKASAPSGDGVPDVGKFINLKEFDMKKRLLLLCLLGMGAAVQAQWAPAGDRIKTRWAESVDPARVLPEYPRPLMERSEWVNLNGLWDYAIVDAGGGEPLSFDGKILVPFAVESSLSGVGRRVGESKELWYSRTFGVPSAWRGRRVLLHFGAVDWKADVWVNGVRVGGHKGGYAPFSFDVTAALASRGDNRLVVRVWDPTDRGHQPRGKQVNDPKSIWYTPVTGIWQTVWMEPVGECSVRGLRITPDINRRSLTVDASIRGACASDVVEVRVTDGERRVASGRAVAGQAVEVPMPGDMKLWSPESPFLYGLEVVLTRGGKTLDRVKSYAAMRKFSVGTDRQGIVRLMLNDKPLFQYGPLDQGWWPDGLYTAPTDEALAYDVVKTKEWGFNMIRKHVKVEPARWYYHCDRLGVIVWQDMPSGDGQTEWQRFAYFNGREFERTPESEADFRREWKEIMDCLYSYPSVGVWVPFNERWGQFKTEEIVRWTQGYDPTRPVNPASGGNHYPCGDMLDLHHYPDPQLAMYDPRRATVLGEFGGIGRVMEGHLWEPDRNWGYVQFQSSDEVTDTYVRYAGMLRKLVEKGCAAAVYTQTTDVEIEVNGLMTYDRKEVMVDEKRLREANRALCRSLEEE